MKKLLFLFAAALISAHCSDDDKAIDQVFEGVTNGSFIRTVEFIQADLDLNDPDDRFDVIIEQQDVEDGGLLESIDVYASFIDRNPDNGMISDSEVLIDNIKKEDIATGPVGLPRLNLNYSLQELLTPLSISMGSLSCGDQIILRLTVKLTDGRTFTVGSGSSCVIAFETFFSSPYRYIINLVEPIAPELFTGTYRYTSVLDGPFGPTFGPPHLVEITAGARHNVRIVRFPGPPDAQFPGRPRPFYFTL